jgi:signal transduction histidine kinase
VAGAAASAALRAPAVLVASGGVAVTLAALDPGRETTYGGVSTSFAALELGAGLALALATAILIAARASVALATLVAAASAAWFAPVWVGWEGGVPWVRGVGLVLAPLLPALVVAVAAWLPPAPSRALRIARATVATLVVGTTAAVAVARALVRDPIRELHCWSDCTANAFVVRDDIVLARHLTTLLLALGLASGLIAALVGALRLARAAPVTRRGSGPALAAASLAGLALAGYYRFRLTPETEAPGDAVEGTLFVARALTLLALAVAVAWIVLRPRLVRGSVTRLAIDVRRSGAEGGVAALLARAAGDSELRLGYPIGPGERVVDADGRPVAFAAAARVTPVQGDTGVVAFVESRTADAEALERALGPAAQLALGNERLRAEALARLGDATASRRRIVETADAARRRMERDLHDGAQQRMLALTYDLQVARTLAEAAGDGDAVAPLAAALERVVAASEELRDVAHGIFPTALGTSGLEAALESLADIRPLRLAVALAPGRRYPAEVEAAAYAAVSEAADAAAGTVSVAVEEREGRLAVTIGGVDAAGMRLVHIDDRVQAAGGVVLAADGTTEIALPTR